MISMPHSPAAPSPLPLPLTIGKDLNIDGSSLAEAVTISGQQKVDMVIVNSSTQVTFKSLVFTDDRPSPSGPISNPGAAISNAGVLYILDSIFHDTRGICDGGGIYNTGTLEVDSSLFKTNFDPCAGGAIYNDGGTVTISQSTFDANSAGDGGAIYSQNGPLTITDSTFTTNSTSGHGGAVSNVNGTMIIKTSTLEDNSSPLGGAIYTGGGSLTLVNSTLQGNTASEGGGGIYSNGEAVIDNNTFAGNTAAEHGAGFYNNNGALDFSNNIFANAPDEDCYSPYNIGVNSHNFIQDGSCNWSDSSVVGFQSGNPLLAPLGDYGGPTETMPLLPGSPAIDAGDYSTCTSDPVSSLDQRGESRTSAGSTCDVGAFETQGFSLESLTGIPQSAPLNTAFDTPLGLTVTANNSGEPVEGGLVTFAAPISGASAALNGSPASIDSDGKVSVIATANGMEGSYTVTASAGGADSQDFDLTNYACQSAITVTSRSDSGAWTLRQAIADICSGGTIDFDTDVFNTGTPGDNTISLDSQLDVDKNMTIDASGISPKVILDSQYLELSGDTCVQRRHR